MTLESRIAASIAAERDLHKMCRAMNKAGYVAFADEFQAAKEQEDRWVFVAVEEDGTFTIGAFMKSGDFAAQPIGTANTEKFAMDLFDGA